MARKGGRKGGRRGVRRHHRPHHHRPHHHRHHHHRHHGPRIGRRRVRGGYGGAHAPWWTTLIIILFVFGIVGASVAVYIPILLGFTNYWWIFVVGVGLLVFTLSVGFVTVSKQRI